ncbi:DUF6705 family protein [Psychroflexus sp. ALD_RP9]|uniref:DUF6705 family protein n=1 Tax=Psychroflexus sp. ALD_RP9 TaxID=2777186 RepID=UPI001A905174|nr:hypothetical protein [Psychroflexus sp. ALD_RP9]QSS98056.1 hypothetical protein IMZ30_04905 [Psychroflexus sp. ALD_RP9]
MNTRLILPIILLLLGLSTSIKAQTTNIGFNRFIGTWEHQFSNSNQIFRVIIFQKGDNLAGHCRMLEVNAAGEETYVYRTDYLLPHFDGERNTYCLFGGIKDPMGMYASIDDNTINYELGLYDRKLKRGSLSIDLLPRECATCPQQATWLVEERTLKGLRIIGKEEPEHFNIPTNLILTKVE